MIKGISIYDIITVSTLMFFIGAYGFISRKNLITMLMAIELMLNAVISILLLLTNTYIRKIWKDIFTPYLL